MHEIKDSALLLMERMDDIVWSINPRNDSLDNLLMRVRHFATTVFEAKGIDYTIDIPKNISELRLPMDYRQHIYLILKEAINNLVKYAGASRAVIEVRWEANWLNLCVRDNGKGFDSTGITGGNVSSENVPRGNITVGPQGNGAPDTNVPVGPNDHIARGKNLSTTREGNGLIGMRRRAQLMEADLHIRSSPGKGTDICLSVKVG